MSETGAPPTSLSVPDPVLQKRELVPLTWDLRIAAGGGPEIAALTGFSLDQSTAARRKAFWEM